VDVADLQTGNAQAGQQYFNGAGGCAKCHSPTGDLAGLATRLRGLQLFQRMLYPGGRGRGGAAPVLPTATIRLPSGQTVTGKVAYRDEFTIAITDADGYYRSWPMSQVKATIDNPLDAHIAQLPKYTNDDLHNVLAYLQTLK
jgi:cytochrome c oxidase cbb3-type subunit 3